MPDLIPFAIRLSTLRPAIGIAVVLTLATAARLVSSWLPPVVNEITLGVILGIALGNLSRLHTAILQGVAFMKGTPFRLGIALLGAGLSFGDVMGTGAAALSAILVCVAFVLTVVLVLGRAANLPGRLIILIGVGTAICGNSAIAATAPVIDAKDDDVSFAVGTITLFGVLAVLVYPMVGALLGLSDSQFGHWAGLAVNDTSQVAAAGFAYSTQAGEIATVVKLTRNILILPMVVAVAALYRRSQPSASAHDEERSPWRQVGSVVPLFVLGFLALAALNSLGGIPAHASLLMREAAKVLILTALVSIGLTTNLGQMRVIGVKPLMLGFGAAGALSLLALTLVRLLLD